MAAEKKVSVKIVGDTSDLTNKLKSTTASLAKWGAASVAAAAAASFALINSGINSVDALAKQSRALNMTSKDLQILQRAADLSGISSQQLTTAMRTLTIGLGQAANGTGTAQKTLGQLGVSLNELEGMSGAEKIGYLTQKIKETIPASQQAAAMADLFGSRAALAMSNLSADDISRATNEIDKFNLALTETELAQVEAANDAMSQMSLITQSVTQRLAVQFAPTLTAVSDLLGDAASESGLFKDGLNDLADFGIGALGVVADGVQILYSSVLGLQALFNKVSGNVAALNAKKAASQLEALNKMGADDEKIGFFQRANFDMAGGAETIGEAKKVVKQRLDEYIKEFEDADAKLENVVGNINSISEEWFSKKISDMAANNEADAAETGAQREREYSALGIADIANGTGSEDEEKKSEIDKKREETEGILNELRNRYKSEQELLDEQYVYEGEALIAALDQKLITQQEYDELMLNQTQNFMDRQSEIEKKSTEALEKLKQNLKREGMDAINSLLEQGGKKGFEISKAISIGETTMSTITAAEESYKSLAGIPVVGPALGAAAAATAIVSGIARVNQIKSQQYGGGGSPAAAGSSATPAIAQAAQTAQAPERQVANITLQGSMFSRDSVVALAEQMSELSADGVRFNIK